MSNSSQQDDSLKDLTINSLDTIDLSGITGSSIDYSYNYICGSDTITLTGAGAQPVLTTMGTSYTVGALTTDQITQLQSISIDTSTYNSWANISTQDWIHNFPSWNKIQDMCVQYPGLKVAFENFKTFYEMCKDDYDNPTPKK